MAEAVNGQVTVDQVRRACQSLDGRSRRGYGFAVSDIKPAAAVVPILDHSGEAAVLVTKRPSTMQFHKDDWVFPGGRLDDRDSSPLEAAVRELREELGVPSTSVEVLGHLATYGPFITGFLLHVYVGIVLSAQDVAPDPREVAEVRIVPLSRLTAEGAYRTGDLPAGHDAGPTVDRERDRPGRSRPLRFFSIEDGQYLWGTQGEILWDLLSVLFHPKDDEIVQ